MAKINLNINMSDLLNGLKGLKGLKGLRVFSVLIWPGVILVACGAVLTAALLMASDLRQKVSKESVPMDNQIRSMLKSSPSAGQVAVEKRYQEEFQQDANLIQRLSVQCTQRELLSYDLFPQPKDTSVLLFTRFGEKYRQGIEGLTQKLNARDCPTADELSVARQASNSSRLSRLSPSGGTSLRIEEEICLARAKAASVYANPLSIGGYEFWKTYKYSDIETSVKDCWYWQIGYWIIEDVFSTVNAMNAGSDCVLNSPVKRIEGVGFVTPDTLIGGTGTIGTASQEKPKYVTKPEEQLTESFTGRISNADIDVVHFSMVVVLSNKAIIPFMRELCSAKEHKFTGFTGQEPQRIFKHNQITILESRVKPLYVASEGHQHYRYGTGSVVEVELVCEYIFNKKGYEAIKPELTKNPAAKTGG
jgi:hypothetical protein